MGYTIFKNGKDGKTPINDNSLNNMQKELMKLVFPIGSTYITQADTNPSEILEFGTWERVKGKVLVGLDENDADFNKVGKEGGEKTHKLTIAEMPKHLHKLGTNINCTGFGTNNKLVRGTGGSFEDKDEETYIKGAGNDQPHNNLQPYRVVGYMWIRTA